MKNIILTFIAILVGVETFVIGFCVFSTCVRKNRLEEHVSRTLKETLEQEFLNPEEEAVYQKLQENLEVSSKNSRMEAKIICFDLQKGILQAEVTEYYRQFNGRERSLSCVKTVIMEQVGDLDQDGGYATPFVFKEGGKATSIVTGASVYTDAKLYFETYDKQMTFRPGSEQDGIIYFGTKAKLSQTNNTVFKTLGWKVSVVDQSGRILDSIYYAMDGSQISRVDVKKVDGYNYALYAIPMKNIRDRISKEAEEALHEVDCKLIFDACLTVVRKGVVKGGMTDAGISWGQVYTTYEGILGAANWGKSTRELLRTYYGKEIEDLFFEVKLEAGMGIEAVYGAGRYCYGTVVTVEAVPKKNYQVTGWSGSLTGNSQKLTFTIQSDVTLRAEASLNCVTVHLYRNYDDADEVIQTIYIPLDGQEASVTAPDWDREGYELVGWSTSRVIESVYFNPNATLTWKWLELAPPEVDLYAVWREIDLPPVIRGEAIYVSLKDVQDGVITPEWLGRYVGAEDDKDGKLIFHPSRVPGFYIRDFDSQKYRECTTETILEETFYATDSKNQTTWKEILVYVLEDRKSRIDVERSYVRFISADYYWDEEGDLRPAEEGGLEEGSLWLTQEEYRLLLEEALEKE